MSAKKLIEKRRQELEDCIDDMAKKEIAKINKETNDLKAEATRIGERVEAELAEQQKEKKKS